MLIRSYAPEDCPAIAAILNHEIEHGVSHFGTTPTSAACVRAEFEQLDLERCPAFVGDDNGQVLGFCKSAPWQQRGAYAWSVEITVYVRADSRGRGVGRALYGRLIPALRDLGYRTAIGGITLPNSASVALHESVGMTRVALYPSIGYKHGAWRDVGYWALDLNPGMAGRGAAPSVPG